MSIIKKIDKFFLKLFVGDIIKIKEKLIKHKKGKKSKDKIDVSYYLEKVLDFLGTKNGKTVLKFLGLMILGLIMMNIGISLFDSLLTKIEVTQNTSGMIPIIDMKTFKPMIDFVFGLSPIFMLIWGFKFIRRGDLIWKILILLRKQF